MIRVKGAQAGVTTPLTHQPQWDTQTADELSAAFGRSISGCRWLYSRVESARLSEPMSSYLRYLKLDTTWTSHSPD